MHGTSAFGLLVEIGRHRVAPIRRTRPLLSNVRRGLTVAFLAALAVVAVLDCGGLLTAQASSPAATSVATSRSPAMEGVGLMPEEEWAADESRRGVRPDAAH